MGVTVSVTVYVRVWMHVSMWDVLPSEILNLHIAHHPRTWNPPSLHSYSASERIGRTERNRESELHPHTPCSRAIIDDIMGRGWGTPGACGCGVGRDRAIPLATTKKAPCPTRGEHFHDDVSWQSRAQQAKQGSAIPPVRGPWSSARAK